MKKTVSSSQEASVLEHLRARRVEFPKVPFARGSVLSRDFNEAVIQTEVMSD